MNRDFVLKPALVVLVASVGLGVVFNAGSHTSPAAAPVAAVAGQPASPLIRAPRQHPPRLPGPRFGTSQNWSGYAAYNQTGVQSVGGSWSVPAARYDSGCASTTYSSTWVGIDGYSSGTVEQLGTEQDWNNGSPRYYAWWEMYPRSAYYVTANGAIASVSANDSITATVTYSNNGTFTLYMKNKTKGWDFTTTQKMPQARRTSAEWIVEAPFSGGITPLADFGTQYFSSCSAAIGSLTKPVLSCSPLDPIAMVNSSGKQETTYPSNPGPGSDSFSISWMNYCQ